MMTAIPPVSGQARINVFCVDDNPLVADAISLTIKSSGVGELGMAGSVSSADAMLDQARLGRWRNGAAPDVVLLDIDMPGKNPFEAIAELEAICGAGRGKPRVIMYTGLLEKPLVDRALESGAWGYVAKSDSPESLLTAIREVAAGSFSFSPAVRSIMGDQ
jgi:DNA-binding NarL/FixJ family response regulator